MKTIRFLSKVTLICNISFLIFALLNAFEKNRETGDVNTLPTLTFFKNLVITLGFSAIFINLLMCISYGVLLATGKKSMLTGWIILVNFVFLLLQFFFFFL